MTERQGIREGYRSLNPYIVVEGVEPLLGFLSEALGDSVLMLSEASENPARPSVVFAYVATCLATPDR
jgi:hypothetical protein